MHMMKIVSSANIIIMQWQFFFFLLVPLDTLSSDAQKKLPFFLNVCQCIHKQLKKRWIYRIYCTRFFVYIIFFWSISTRSYCKLSLLCIIVVISRHHSMKIYNISPMALRYALGISREMPFSSWCLCFLLYADMSI